MTAPAGWDVLTTADGPAVVLHRLAVAVECRDAVTDRVVASPVTGRYRRLPPNGAQPWKSPQMRGFGRIVLLHAIPDDPQHRLPKLEIALDDPARRYVPRRVTITPWTYAEVAEPAPFVEAHARLLRLWLSPGASYQLPASAAVIRGRVLRSDGTPARWARIRGTTPTSVAGWAHADERGEFLLAVTDPGLDAAHDFSPLIVTLTAYAAPAQPVDPADRTADLVSESVPHSSNPPAAGDLDAPLLRGTAVPPGYVASTTPGPNVIVPFGTGVNVQQPIVVTP